MLKTGTDPVFISGFTIARRAIEYGYPLQESLRSLLPLVDELIVNVGDCDDGTWEAVQEIGDPRIQAFRSTWSSSLSDGLALSEETNKALARCRGTWAVYLQADEVLHEAELPALRDLLVRLQHSRIEALSLRYHHFYGSYHTVKDEPRWWYRRATRIVRTGVGVESVGDAAAFSVREGSRWRRPRRRDINTHVFHYGRVRPPAQMIAKQRGLERFYHSEAWLADHGTPADLDPSLIYADGRNLVVFRGSHPRVMHARIAAQDWPSTLPARMGPEWWRRARAYSDWVLHWLVQNLRRAVGR